MNRLFFILLWLIANVSLGQDQASWFSCAFTNSDASGIELDGIKLITTNRNVDFLQDFSMYKNQVIASQSTSSKKNIVGYNFQTNSKSDLTQSTSLIKLFKSTLSQRGHSLVVHDQKDYLLRSGDDGYSTILSSAQIVDYCWIDDEHVAVVERLESGNMEAFVFNIENQKKNVISINPGERIRRIAESKVAFVDIFSNEYRYIKSYDLIEQRSKIVIKLPVNITKFDLRDNGQYFIAQNDKLLAFQQGQGVEWKTFYDFAHYNFHEITDLYILDGQKIILRHEK